MYYVIGGIYTSFGFKDLVKGTKEKYGPFETYIEAYDAWKASVWRNVDNGNHRLKIVEDEEMDELKW